MQIMFATPAPSCHCRRSGDYFSWKASLMGSAALTRANANFVRAQITFGRETIRAHGLNAKKYRQPSQDQKLGPTRTAFIPTLVLYSTAQWRTKKWRRKAPFSQVEICTNAQATFLRRRDAARPARPAPNSDRLMGSGASTGSVVRTVFGNAPEIEPVVEPSGPE